MPSANKFLSSSPLIAMNLNFNSCMNMLNYISFLGVLLLLIAISNCNLIFHDDDIHMHMSSKKNIQYSIAARFLFYALKSATLLTDPFSPLPVASSFVLAYHFYFYFYAEWQLGWRRSVNFIKSNYPQI